MIFEQERIVDTNSLWGEHPIETTELKRDNEGQPQDIHYL
jgi:hypothetical protein